MLVANSEWLKTCSVTDGRCAPEKSSVCVACVARSHDQVFMKALSIHAAVLAVFATITTTPNLSYSAEKDLNEIKAEITKRQDESVKRLQDWIGRFPSQTLTADLLSF